MLTLALAATLVGFVLLVLGLVTGTVWLAVACIVICLIGLGLLVADIVTAGRRGEPEADSGSFLSLPDDDVGGDDVDADRRRTVADGPPTRGGPAPPSGGGTDTAPYDEGPSLGDVVRSRDADGDVTRPRDDSGVLQADVGVPSDPNRGAQPTGTTRIGGYDDYVRSVGGPGGADPAESYAAESYPDGYGTDRDPATDHFPPQRRNPEPTHQDPMTHGAPQQNPAQQYSAPQYSAQQYSAPQYPRSTEPPTATPAPWPSLGDDPRFDATRDDPAGAEPSEREPGGRRRARDPETGRARDPETRGFDPLDPNWRPPLD
ncbi:hypothetical protein [Gordonia soli]|uniref:Uncharacterized protein n=1 Tax=Gordonia soli NBRC 108243 TaxID=1223545 RepID=M0QMY7_9ACTN|nr:hypothetical protein [Gordonia soli]GAC70025.1 hypothetical protein GS4_30_00970 [Gordonia soli NBRC 108243]